MNQKILKEPYIRKVLDWVKRKSYSKVKARVEGEKFPAAFFQKSTERWVRPDITATHFGRKYYFEVGLKTDKVRNLVTKWKLLSRLAAMKRGNLYIFAPFGHKAFVDRVCEQYNIKAKIVSLRNTAPKAVTA